MGSLAESSSLQTIKMMKSIAVVALCMFAAAAGEADASADAGLHYGHYGYGHALGYAHHGYYGYPYAHHYGHYYGKSLLMPSLKLTPLLLSIMAITDMDTLLPLLIMDTMDTHMSITMDITM